MQRVLAEVKLSDPTVFSPAKNFTSISSIVNIIVSNAFVLAGIIAFVLLIFGGIGFIVASGSGDSKQLQQGQKAITGAVIGLIIIVTSVWIIQIIESITGFSILNH